MDLYFVYDRPSRQWFTAGRKFYNEVMCEKMTNPNFKLNAFMKKFYYTEKKAMVILSLLAIKEEAQVVEVI